MDRVVSVLVQVALVVVLVGLVLTGSLFFGRHHVARIAGDLPAFSHTIGARRGVEVPMRDGVKLQTQVILPSGDGPWPVVLIRNPYNLLNAFTFVCEMFARNGYACVHQDVRGRMGSEGEWSPLVNEREDGLDTLAWLREQDFQDGRWGLFGMSYLAGVQWAVADALPPEVKTMVSMVFGVDTYGVMYERGLFRHDVFSAWAALMPDEGLSLWNGGAYAELIRHRPARDADEAVLGRRLEWYRQWIDAWRPDHPLWTDPPFSYFLATPTRVGVPVLMLGGYYDPFFEAQLEDFHRLATREKSKLVIGPWHHLQRGAADYALPDSLGIAGQWELILAWLAHHLKGAPERPAVGVVETYDLGAGAWRRREAFPPAPVEQLRFHLGGFARAASCPGGHLTTASAFRREPSASWRYDPEDPYPSEGGASALSFAIGTFPSVNPGARRRATSCGRDDLLRFVSPPLERPLHIVGRPRALLRASSTAEDTAFGFELQAQLPGEDDWYHVREAFGALSALTSTPTERGEVAELELDAWPIEHTLPAGARLQLEVRSASFPLYAAHPNVLGPWGAAETSTAAHQTLYPGSWIELPLGDPDAPTISGEALSRPAP